VTNRCCFRVVSPLKAGDDMEIAKNVPQPPTNVICETKRGGSRNVVSNQIYPQLEVAKD
jgi:hypothetical protein